LVEEFPNVTVNISWGDELRNVDRC
jgi:hypothetical protein